MTKLLDELLDIGEERFKATIGTKDQLIPHWLLVSQEGQKALIATPWHTELERNVVVKAIRDALKAFNCVAYSLSHEAWAAPEPRGEWPEGYRPSKDPARKEVFMVSACDGTTEVSRVYNIARDPDGACAGVFLDYTSHESGGALANLFKP